MSRTALIAIMAILAFMGTTALWRLQHPPLEPRQTIWMDAGLAEMELGRFHSARKIFERVLTRNPDHPVASANLSFIQLFGSPDSELSNEDALAEYQSLARLHPESPYLTIIGSILHRRNHTPRRSMKILQDATKDNPEIPHLWFEMAMSKRMLGDHGGAIDALHKALDLGHRAAYFNELGNEYFYTGNWTAAKQNYQNALDLNSRIVAPKTGILRCLVLMNRTAEAIEYGEQLLRKVKKSPNKIKHWLNRSSSALIRGTSRYSVESGLSFHELRGFIETEIELARSRTSFQGMRAERWKLQLGSRVYALLEFEIKHLGLEEGP